MVWSVVQERDVWEQAGLSAVRTNDRHYYPAGMQGALGQAGCTKQQHRQKTPEGNSHLETGLILKRAEENTVVRLNGMSTPTKTISNSSC